MLKPTKQPSFAGECVQMGADIMILPVDIMLNLLINHVDPSQILNLSETCRAFRSLCSEPHLWKGIVKKHFPNFHQRLCLRALGKSTTWRQSLHEPLSPMITARPNALQSINWKGEYFQRTRIQNNWRKGVYSVAVMEMHRDAVTCVDFGDKWLVTGSTDGSLRVIELRPHLHSSATSTPVMDSPMIHSGGYHSGVFQSPSIADRFKTSAKMKEKERSSTPSIVPSREDTSFSQMKTGFSNLLNNAPKQGSPALAPSSNKSLTKSSNGTNLKERGRLTVSYGYVPKPKTLGVPIPVTPPKTRVLTGGIPEALLGNSKQPTAATAVTDIFIHDLPVQLPEIMLHDWNVLPRYLHPIQCNFEITCLALDDHNGLVAAGGPNGRLIFSTVSQKNATPTPLEGHTGDVRYVHAADKTVISASSDRTARIWSLDTGSHVVLGDHESAVNRVMLTEREAFTGTEDGILRIWKRDGTLTHVYRGGEGSITGILYSITEEKEYVWISTSSGNITGHIIHRPQSEESQVKESNVADVTLKGHTGPVNTIRLQGHDRLLSGSTDKTAAVWNLKNGKRESVHSTAAPVTFLDSSTDNNMLVYATQYDLFVSSLKRQDAHDEGEVYLHIKNELWVSCLLSDDTLVISGSNDGKVTIMDFSVRREDLVEEEVVEASPAVSTTGVSPTGNTPNGGAFSGFFKKKKK
ncbi:WD40 repeat-containing protein [Planoprotostelium fungivorum]|uniref:WD40 repeat-containing protein n=1 Tax=Planoprotostelium fungivorum TaxID=1890364 RepID=A0A2P6N504_9EUKA|nr:WD40 repeat-containing protein [Planoprotostelium fungivorum]